TRLFSIFHEYRRDVRDVLGKSDVNMIHEAQEIRNQHSHTQTFSTADTLRALDTIARVLEAIQQPELEEPVRTAHDQLMRTLYDEQARSESRKRTQHLKSQGLATLVPWR